MTWPAFHTTIPVLARARPARLAVVFGTLVFLVACAAIPARPWFADRAGAAGGLLMCVGLIWAALSVWLLPILADTNQRVPGSRRQSTVRLAGVVAVFAAASTAPALAWWVHVSAIDAMVPDANELYAVCEPHHVAASHDIPIELYRLSGWNRWQLRFRERGAVYGIPVDGVCPPWDGTYEWSSVARRARHAGSASQWLTREDALGEMLVLTAAVQRRGLIEASSIPTASSLVAATAAAGAVFGLLACCMWFPLRLAPRQNLRFGVYAWIANTAFVALTLRAMLWLPGLYPAPDGGPSAVAAIALAALFVVLMPSQVRGKRYNLGIALNWPLTIGLVLAVPFWVAADVQGSWLSVDPDVWRLPALGTLVAAFALTPLVAAVNERIRAMPD